METPDKSRALVPWRKPMRELASAARKNKRKILIHVFKPVWELALLLEKLPSSMPDDMKARMLIGSVLYLLATAVGAAFLYWQLGFLTWNMVCALLYAGIPGGAYLPLAGFLSGLCKACKQAAREADDWKRAVAERSFPPLLS